MPAADPVGELERCQEEIHRARHDVQVLLIIATGVLALLTMALAVRGDPSWRRSPSFRSPTLRSSLYSWPCHEARPHS